MTLLSKIAVAAHRRHVLTGFPQRRITSVLRRGPDFIVIGAMKCGTTSLYAHLCRHPQVIPAARKEIHFFDPEHFHRGERWYRAHFPTWAYSDLVRRRTGAETITGEASPSYVLYPHTPTQVRAIAPEVKLIVLLREPVDRAFSQYHHNRSRGWEPLSFEAAIAAEPNRLEGEWDRLVADPGYVSVAFKKYTYLTRGAYAPQLDRWKAVFPADQLLVLDSAEYDRDPAATLGVVEEFLGLDRWPRERHRRANVGRYDAMAPETRERLTEHFRGRNRELRSRHGIDFGWPQ